jgi:NDP-sugar pyrophosphorylase family protein
MINSFFTLEGFEHAALFEGLSFPWEALAHLTDYLNHQKLGMIEVELPSSVHLVNPHLISIGKGTVVEPGVYIQGPCIIGANCTIRFGAYIRGHLVTGDRCVIGHDTEIKHSILLNGVNAAHFNYVGDCILGNGVNLGAGVKCANLRLDHQPVKVVFNGQKMMTHLKKLGAVVGDGAQIGCNAVTNPGTIIGKNAFCHPCLNISGQIQESEIVTGETQRNENANADRT